MSCVPEVSLKFTLRLGHLKNTTYLAYSCCSRKLTIAKGVPVWGTCTKRHNNGKSQQLKSSQSILMVNGNVFSYYLTLKQSVWHSQKDLHRCTFQVSCMYGIDRSARQKSKNVFKMPAGNQANNGNPLPSAQYVKASRHGAGMGQFWMAGVPVA